MEFRVKKISLVQYNFAIIRKSNVDQKQRARVIFLYTSCSAMNDKGVDDRKREIPSRVIP